MLDLHFHPPHLQPTAKFQSRPHLAHATQFSTRSRHPVRSRFMTRACPSTYRIAFHKFIMLTSIKSALKLKCELIDPLNIESRRGTKREIACIHSASDGRRRKSHSRSLSNNSFRWMLFSHSITFMWAFLLRSLPPSRRAVCGNRSFALLYERQTDWITQPTFEPWTRRN